METLQRTANRGSISTATYEIDNSLKLERANSENIYRQIIDGNRKTWTSSLWIKRVDTATPSYNLFFNHGIYGVGTYLRFNNNDTLTAAIETYGGGTSQVTNAVFRDTSAWMHIVWRVDTTQSTEADRSRIYINGEQITSFSSATYPSQNADTLANHDHGGYDDVELGYKDAGIYSNMYYADVYHVDGQSLAPTEFGELDSDTGIWKPIEADISSFGNNGFYLDFSDASSLGTDSAGNGSFTLSNVTSADQATDTPTNNFCTFNPIASYIQRPITSSGITNGATKVTQTSIGAWCGGIATMGVKSGKWYYEAKIYDTDDLMLGFSTFSGDTSTTTAPHAIGTNIIYYGGGSSGSYWFYYVDGTATSNSSNRGTAWSVGDLIGIALDLDNSKANFYVNGSLAGSSNTNVDISDVTDEINSTGDFLIPFAGMWRSTIEFNFGGYTITTLSSAASDANGYGNFEYAPPSGYYALCTQNLALYG